MKTHEPQFNPDNNQWEIWDYAYTENSEDHFEVHRFWTYLEVVKYYNEICGIIRLNK
jgi:hypothetical protein